MATHVEQVCDTAGRKKRDRPDAAQLAPAPRHQRAALLARVVERQILPRLIEARATAESNAATTDQEANALVARLLTRPASDAVGYIEALRQRGVAPATLLLGIITQAARTLGELWADDRCGFADVTIGVGHLQHAVRALSPWLQAGAAVRPHANAVLLLAAPGEQHTFGLVVLSEFFLREGWHVAGGPACSPGDALRLARRSWFDVVGFSIGSDHLLDGLTTCIAAVRGASRNPRISVMVGGPMLLHHPDLVHRTGADAGAADAQAAVREAKSLLSFREAAD